jgi:hypothetical protein
MISVDAAKRHEVAIGLADARAAVAYSTHHNVAHRRASQQGVIAARRRALGSAPRAQCRRWEARKEEAAEQSAERLHELGRAVEEKGLHRK